MPSVGLTLSRQGAAATSAVVDVDDRPPSAVWADLATADGFRRSLVEAVRELLSGTHHAERARTLREAGAVAADGGFATVAVGLDRPPEDDRHADTLDVVAAFGQPEPSILGHLPLEDVREGPLALLDAASRTPTIILRVRQSFRDARADHRRRTCELIAWLAEVADVRLVASGLVARWLASHHRADLPGGVSEQVDAGCGVGAPSGDAVDVLDHDSREVAVLRDLADDPAETLTYHALRSMHEVSRSRVSQVVNRLADLGLVDTFDGPDGRSVELLPGGRELVETFDAEIGRQQTLSDAVSGTGQPPGSPVWTADAHEAATQGSPAGKPPGRFDAAYLSRWHHAAAVGSATTGDVVAVDARIDAAEDGREPGWSFDGDTLAVSAEYGYSALQLWTRIALGLANWRTFRHVLTPDVLDDVLAEHPRAVLRGVRQLGFLPDDVATGEEYVEALEDAAEHVRELTRKRHHAEFDDRAEGASIVTRDALGLATLMVHLLDLAGIDVVREVRLPEFRRNYGPEEREAVARSVATGVAQQSTYAGHHVAYRHLYESRPDRRDAALGVDVDAADPLGEPIGTWVVVGPGVEDLVGDVRRAVRHPADLHDDAPEFAVSVRVGTPGRPAFATTARAAFRAKNLEATREAVSVLAAFTGSPYDAARAVHGLATEDYRRDVRLDEVRLALGTLPADRLLPDAAPTVSKIAGALLRSDAPMTQAEIADAADVSTRSVRRHADRLEAFDLLRERPEGYRLALSHRGERHRDVLPWYATPNAERDDYRDATERGVLWDAVDDDLPGSPTVMDAVGRASTLQVPPDVRRTVVDAWPWAGPLIDAVRSLTAEERDRRHPDTRTVTFGAEIEQAGLGAAPGTPAASAGRGTP